MAKWDHDGSCILQLYLTSAFDILRLCLILQDRKAWLPFWDLEVESNSYSLHCIPTAPSFSIECPLLYFGKNLATFIFLKVMLFSTHAASSPSSQYSTTQDATESGSELISISSVSPCLKYIPFELLQIYLGSEC